MEIFLLNLFLMMFTDIKEYVKIKNYLIVAYVVNSNI